ncbi:bifunctional DNA-formamidopyrimidine glycosylase/DNA-(apurinic or apyrimidinic site) lyase [Salinicoccus halodurans]|uniref:Formamidopyrimidine-DNA glycosylase n=1 Tax=Salinicoccus halodurans TaxID=407035 RepID=A0A0F7HK46_9STAP|nr:bifunctional DNA-formamidopyrimidine glycosylase/DNA-(apurinic or apyrimidinic site) lyase [Salinicoccus halodurans]AKG74233.1 hypothetical protein AAT16_08300 [Salinicoccus halodurans]SFK93352.1 DNA-(apurinic or apyrimidinic site) lyase [Salinicoccus halodurans]
MPELPEVELVKRELSRSVEGRKIESVELSDYVYKGHDTGRKTIVKQDLGEFREMMPGASILKVGRRGKYLFFILEKSDEIFHMIGHLGMSGAFFITGSLEEIENLNYRKHWHVLFNLDDNALMSYCDIRRFGEMSTVKRLNDFAPFRRMAPEYTDPDSLSYFLERARNEQNSKKSVKAVIMDSSVIPGVGNIYASEALFASGILPTKKAGSISVERLRRLHEEIVNVFEVSLSSGGSTISDYRGVSGQSGSMQDRFKIYQKKRCSQCGGDVKTKVIATRNTFYCTKCQR